MYVVYIIKSDWNHYYIGSTNTIEKRLSQHNDKLYKCWTNRYNNWKIIYSEEFSTRKEALIRERKIKSYKGGNEFMRLINSS